jgi:type I restriction enzyme S subunit
MKKDWKIVKIPEVLSFQEGPGVRKHQFTSEGVKLLNVGNINDGQINLNKTKIYISEKEAYGKYKHFLVDDGDLVIASSGIVVSNFHNKIAFISKEHLPLCMNTSTIRFKVINKKIININYFKYFLKTNFFTNQLQRLITGSAQLNFGPSHLKKIDLILPPLEDQKRIVRILDNADSLRQKRKQAIGFLDDYLKSVFLEMFGDPVKNPKGWELVKFTNILVMSRGFDLPKQNRVAGKYPLVASNGIVDRIVNFKVKGPGVVTGRSGTLGSVQLIEEDYWPLNTALYSQKLKGNNPVYLKFFLEYFDLKRFTRGAGVPTLNRNLFHSELVPNVPIELQDKFENIYRNNQFLKQKMLAQSAELEAQFQALMQKAFKGEL